MVTSEPVECRKIFVSVIYLGFGDIDVWHNLCVWDSIEEKTDFGQNLSKATFGKSQISVIDLWNLIC